MQTKRRADSRDKYVHMLTSEKDAFYRLSGYPIDPAMNEKFTFLDICFENNIENIMSQWQLLLAGQPVTFEMRWKDPSPEGRWVQAACTPVMDQHGVIISISGCTIDINDQKKVEMEATRRAEALEKARASEARFLSFAQFVRKPKVYHMPVYTSCLAR